MVASRKEAKYVTLSGSHCCSRLLRKLRAQSTNRLCSS